MFFIQTWCLYRSSRDEQQNTKSVHKMASLRKRSKLKSTKFSLNELLYNKVCSIFYARVFNSPCRKLVSEAVAPLAMFQAMF